MSITVYGASDDLIEIEGDIREEFNIQNEEEGDLLAFSNGVVLRVTYSSGGVWRILPVAGASQVTIKHAPENDDLNYTDYATLNEPALWVVHGTGFAGGTL